MSKENMNSKDEELHKRLESRVLGLLGDSSGKAEPAPEKSDEVKKKGKEKKEDDVKVDDKPKAETAESSPEVKQKAGPAESPPEKSEEVEEKAGAAESATVQTGESQPKEGAAEPAPEENEDPSDKKESTPEDSGKKEEKKKDEEASLDDLLAQREEIEALLSSIEDSYRDATLPDNTYKEVKHKNEKKLEEINKKIEKVQKTATPEQLAKIEEKEEEPEPAPAPAETAVTPAAAPETPEVKEQMKKADSVIKLLEDKIESKLKKVIDTANIEITDRRLKKLEGRIETLETGMKEAKSTSDTASKTVGGYDRQFTTMKTDVEKTKALVDGVKEAKNIMDEKVQRMTETFAEIRSIVYQREAKAKEQEILIDKLRDTLSQVDTARILREFTTRDEQLRDVNTRIERLERSGKMLSDSLSRIKGLMTDIGSLENIVKASKHVGEKLEKIQEIEERMKATMSRMDSVYLDMKKRLDEFSEYRVKQDRLTGMTEDIVKNVEETTRRLADYATKDDITTVKDELKIVRDQAKKSVAQKLPPEIANLQEEKEEIETLLATLEENYKNKEIGEEEYKKAKESNMRKIMDIEKKIAALSSGAKKPVGETKETAGMDHSKIMLLAKLRESYENGEISKSAYDKSRKMLTRR